jgi:hypothetical protein
VSAFLAKFNQASSNAMEKLIKISTPETGGDMWFIKQLVSKPSHVEASVNADFCCKSCWLHFFYLHSLPTALLR